jgi:phosphoribosylamine--glycine ligase
VEIAVCGFFNGEKFVEPVNMNFEHKKLFSGNIGPSTGEMGTSMFWTKRNRVFDRTLGKLEDWLAEEGYVGSIDINSIVNSGGIYPLEFTPRFGYPTIALQEEGMNIPTGEFFYDLANGRDPDLTVHRGYQVGVRIVLPPYPFDDEKIYDENSRNAAVVFDTDDRDGIHIEDAKKVDGQWRVAGEAGMPLVVTGKGATMREAQKQAYSRIDDITIPNMYYRDDIGDRWNESDGDLLQAWGYLGP